MFKVLAGAVTGVGLLMLGAALKDGDFYHWVAAFACLAVLFPLLLGVRWEEQQHQDPSEPVAKRLKAKGYGRIFIGLVDMISNNDHPIPIPSNLARRLEIEESDLEEPLRSFYSLGLLEVHRRTFPDSGNPYQITKVTTKGQDVYLRLTS